MYETFTYLPSSAIDAQKWNACVESDPEGRVYGSYHYLNFLSSTWGGLIWGDYEAVFPVSFNKKFGIGYMYQPAFVQQQSVYTSHRSFKISLQKSALAYCSSRFPFAEICLSFLPEGVHHSTRQNLELPLDHTYDTIRSNFKQDLVNNLRIAERFPFTQSNEPTVEELMQLFKLQYADKLSYKETDYNNLFAYLRSVGAHNNFFIRGAYLNGMLAAGALFLQHKNRLYLLLNYTSSSHRKKAANHWLLNRCIHEFAGTGLILDFEGSDQPGIAHYYKNFGALTMPYYQIGWNRLPWPLKLFKTAY